MNIRQLDLNLLLVFDAIYRERSISAAARKLNLSQPAVSNALSRLRHFTNDQLFYRSNNAMLPTRAANALAVPIGHALSAVEAGFSVLQDFDPATSTRTFRLGINDFVRLMVIPTLANAVEREAPGVHLDFRPEMKSPPEMIEALHRGEVDLIFLPAQVRGNHNDISVETVNADKLIFVVRKGHPALERDVTDKDLVSLRFVTADNSPALRAIVEAEFARRGVERRISCSMPDTLTIPAIIEMTDGVAIMGYHYFLRHQKEYALSQLHLPFELPHVDGALFWSRSLDGDTGHQWLRKQVADIMKTAVAMQSPELM
ncbi:LysR family transcriptional regulator [Parvibaculum sp.]|uniref:LysR family transcriptional regulator n=1 Tax=Parvibaculum sp. TaxID=2024848 RepID=UPI001B1EB0F3|nr:LysR family transcriptional regulator [Parvibaculum sp.]MBO6634499.1 LysR family transcriptional regulator [Parvibaculum sp.]MBO6678242.1 LysR family transcriptional regulator [Parvibaculum sp.]MBO6685442.1 LysR family transcriptional regulator [Parvibaculum sp.]